VPDNYQARSLLPLLRGAGAGWPAQVVAEFHGHRYLFSQRMVRWANYKYVFNASSFDELYDLEQDPYELENRIDDPASARAAEEGRRRMLTHILEHGDPLRFSAECLLSG